MKYFFTVTLHLIFIGLILKSINFGLPNLIIGFYTFAFNALLFVTVSMITFGITKRVFLNDKINPSKKAVLITGCDSGFGHHLAKRLDSKGFHVFASCLAPSGLGATSLKESCSLRLKVLELNVTEDESVKKALEFVKANLGSSELWAIVNNAGIQLGLSVEVTDTEEFRKVMEVNAIGPVRVTKAFLPLLKQSKGRVINLTSASGRTTIPDMTPYFMSKHAATAFSDCLRQELDMWDIGVISVEPLIFQTRMADPKRGQEMINNTLDAAKKTVEKEFDGKCTQLYKKKLDFLLSFGSSKIELVIDDLEVAISLKYPASTYETYPSFLSKFAVWMLREAPIDVRDFIQKIVAFVIVRFY